MPQRLEFKQQLNFLVSKQARKSSEDTQVTGYARFEKSLGQVSFEAKKFVPKIF